MNIDKDILLAWGGKLKKFRKDEFIFMEGDKPRYYHQVIEGSVKLYNTNDNAGKEFTQGMFTAGQSFGEPPLMIEEEYPSTASALCESLIMLVPRDSFIRILHEYPDLHFRFTNVLATRIYNKSITFREVMSNSPQTRILGFLKSYKKKMKSENAPLIIPFTRQEIANFTGLRVETVIRTLHKMCDEKLVEIREHKLYY